MAMILPAGALESRSRSLSLAKLLASAPIFIAEAKGYCLRDEASSPPELVRFNLAAPNRGGGSCGRYRLGFGRAQQRRSLPSPTKASSRSSAAGTPNTKRFPGLRLRIVLLNHWPPCGAGVHRLEDLRARSIAINRRVSALHYALDLVLCVYGTRACRCSRCCRCNPIRISPRRAPAARCRRWGGMERTEHLRVGQQEQCPPPRLHIGRAEAKSL